MSLVLHPSTGQDAVSQFVRLTLTLTLDPQVRRLLQTFAGAGSAGVTRLSPPSVPMLLSSHLHPQPARPVGR